MVEVSFQTNLIAAEKIVAFSLLYGVANMVFLQHQKMASFASVSEQPFIPHIVAYVPIVPFDI